MSRRAFSAKNKMALDEVKTFGGKEVVLNRLVNHYKAIYNVKPKVIIETPHPHVDAGKIKTKTNLNMEANYNIRQTYKGVAAVKAQIDAKTPFTFNMGKNLKHIKAKDKFDDEEHIRRLNAMSKRILSLGKPHERRKNIHDPVGNPTYFFRKPGDDSIKLVSLDVFNEKLKEMNTDEKNRLLLGDTIYNAVGKETNKNKRPSTAKASTNTYIRYNSCNTQSIKNKSKVYTHIFVDPQDIIKQHLKDRVTNQKATEEEIANYTKKSLANAKSKLVNTANLEVLNEKTKNLIPLADKNLDDFQMKIINYIVNNRIFKQKDLDNLLNQLLIKNQNIKTEDEIRNVFQHVIEELDK